MHPLSQLTLSPPPTPPPPLSPPFFFSLPQVVSSALTDTASPSSLPRRACTDGRVTDWDALEALLYRSLYSDCGWLAGEEGCLLVVEPVRTPRRDRERWAQLAFERFNAAGLFALDAPVAALYAVGRSSGTVIDVGHDKTDVACVLDGGVVTGSAVRLASGGAASEGVLAARLATRGVNLTGLDPAVLRAAKQAAAAARPSRAAALEGMVGCGEGAPPTPSPTTLTLPDGTAVAVTAGDGIAVAEALVTPSDAVGVRADLAGRDSLAAVALASVAAAGSESAGGGGAASGGAALAARRAALETLVLCGGGARVPGLAHRLESDVRAALPAWAASPPTWPEPPSYLPPHACGALAAWTGGAIAAKTVFVQNQHATRADYDEMGPIAIFRRGAGG